MMSLPCLPTINLISISNQACAGAADSKGKKKRCGYLAEGEAEKSKHKEKRLRAFHAGFDIVVHVARALSHSSDRHDDSHQNGSQHHCVFDGSGGFIVFQKLDDWLNDLHIFTWELETSDNPSCSVTIAQKTSLGANSMGSNGPFVANSSQEWAQFSESV